MLRIVDETHNCSTTKMNEEKVSTLGNDPRRTKIG